MEHDKTPLGIKVISIVFFVCAIFLIVFSIILLFSFSTLTDKTDIFPFLAGMTSGVTMALILLVITLFFIMIGVYLWKKKQWARIASLIFIIVGIVGAIINISSGRWLSIINIVLYLLIGTYLIFSKKVRAAFASRY